MTDMLFETVKQLGAAVKKTAEAQKQIVEKFADLLEDVKVTNTAMFYSLIEKLVERGALQPGDENLVLSRVEAHKPTVRAVFGLVRTMRDLGPETAVEDKFKAAVDTLLQTFGQRVVEEAGDE